jgi:hypothetical protein
MSAACVSDHVRDRSRATALWMSPRDCFGPTEVIHRRTPGLPLRCLQRRRSCLAPTPSRLACDRRPVPNDICTWLQWTGCPAPARVTAARCAGSLLPMAVRTEIHFRDGEEVIVDGAAMEVGRVLHTDGPARLTTIEGATVVVNWSNVLYIEETRDDRPPVPRSSYPPGMSGQTD